MQKKNSLFGAAILKLSFFLKGKMDDPGFRVVYFGTLKELGLKDSQVDEYIRENEKSLIEHINRGKKGD